MTEGRTITAQTELAIGGDRLKLELVVPLDEVPPESLLPTLHELSNQIVSGVESKVDKSEELNISCKKGCGACCRQPVPISPPEARLLNAMVNSMPDKPRAQMKQRFKKAALRLQDSGLLNKTMNYHELSAEERITLVQEYFALGIACPFLEEESCSIHPNRPLICREYLVISSPDYCASLTRGKVKRLTFPVSVSKTFSTMDGVNQKGGNDYLPLIMALEWVEQFPDEVEFRPGTEWVQEFFTALSGADIPDPDAEMGVF